MPILDCRNVTKSFGGLTALNGVSFAVEKGEILGLIGPNGAGKTTLFKVITGIYSPDQGAIRFKGKDIVGRKPHEITRMGIGRTFQSVRTFLNQTVFESIMMIATFGRGYGGSNTESPEETVKRVFSLLTLEAKRDALVKELTIPDRKYADIDGSCLDPELFPADNRLG